MKLKSLCLLALFSFSYADANLDVNSYVKEYNNDVISAKYSSIDYASENNEVQVELYVDNKTKGLMETGYVNKIVLCDLLRCKVYSYKPNEILVNSSQNKFYSEFKAKLTTGSMVGHICNDSYNVCHSHVILDVKYDSQFDFEANLMLRQESAIRIQKLTKSYIND